MSRLKGRVAIVTGASAGIGKAIAKRFLDEGASVVITDINAESLMESVTELKANGLPVVAITQDVSREEDWQKVIQETIQHFGYLNILVNNAGIGGKEGIRETTLEQWEKVQKVNLNSVFLGMKYAAEKMIEVKGGSIINISSIYGLIGNGEAASYHASKSAIRGLTKTAAVEFAKDCIRINTIHPGVIETQMTNRKLLNPEILKELKQLTPLPYFGKPIDVANGALYLASDEASFVTGTELVIDGGYIIQ